MSAIRQTCARLLSVFRKHDLDRDFDEEVHSHIALATEDYIQRGLPPTEARRRARVAFGFVEASKDAHRDSRGLPWLEDLFHDLRFASRGLRRDPAFTATALVMLSLAIGLNVTVFAVMNTMLFRGFPRVKRNNRLVYIQERYPSGVCCISYPDFENWRAEAKSFQSMAFVGGRAIAFSDGNGRPTAMSAATLSANAFGVLGVRPLLGRDFNPSDQTPGAPTVAILSYHFWVSRFAKRPDIAGLGVRINNAPATIVGVMPDGFDFPDLENMWLPLTRNPDLLQRASARGNYLAAGRLRDGATIEQARAELETINRRLAAEYPATNRGVTPSLGTHSQVFIGPDTPMIYGSLWAAAWFVLLIACANLSNLMLARTIGRSREFSARLALGAGQGRIVR